MEPTDSLNGSVDRDSVDVQADMSGWVACIDGEQTHIFMADGLLRAVVVPSGRHEVVFRYEPWSVTLGFLISLITSATIILILVARKTAVLRKFV